MLASRTAPREFSTRWIFCLKRNGEDLRTECDWQKSNFVQKGSSEKKIIKLENFRKSEFFRVRIQMLIILFLSIRFIRNLISVDKIRSSDLHRSVSGRTFTESKTVCGRFEKLIFLRKLRTKFFRAQIVQYRSTCIHNTFANWSHTDNTEIQHPLESWIRHWQWVHSSISLNFSANHDCIWQWATGQK